MGQQESTKFGQAHLSILPPSFLLVVNLGRGLFQRGTSYFLYTPVVIDYLYLVTDLVRSYGCRQVRRSVDIFIIYPNDNITCS
jgi:hypothetical protein